MPLTKISTTLANLRNRHFFIYDLLILPFTPWLALLIRYDWDRMQIIFDKTFLLITLMFFVIKISLLRISGLYRRFWKTASIDDLARLVLIGVYLVIFQTFSYGVIKSLNIWDIKGYPISFPFIDTTVSFVLIALPRFSIRLLERASQRLQGNGEGIPTLVVGAGDAGIIVLTELQKNRELRLVPIGFIDDDPYKKGLMIRGLQVYGGREIIEDIVNTLKIEKIIIALPSAKGQEIKEILYVCQKTKADILTVPGISEIIDGRISFQKFRKIDIEDLLRREPIVTDMNKIGHLIKGKKVLVTGAGGSIGREICRQVMKYKPSKLLLLGHGENSIFEIEQELLDGKKEKKEIIQAIIADIKDAGQLRTIFASKKPEVVFHAAAHKHVPLMEDNVSEAVINNVLGTKNILDISVENKVEAFVMISTDKAVGPTSIMGATKTVAEMLVQDRYQKTSLKLLIVRFGNVLGSRGSVIHTFKKQILGGGPVTVTHPLVERYFMTIPEAVQLVLQSFAIGKGGEIFVFDMAERIKIVDLAKDMIRLSGYTEEDIRIEYTGLRPGEKMIEELFNGTEQVEKTEHEKLMLAKRNCEKAKGKIGLVDELISLADDHNEQAVKLKLFEIVELCKEEVSSK